uniref:17.5 protein n=1 Tax=Gallus gallus TaxID=9031 RepID=Q90636_CHICK|nr:amino acid feature: cytoplasmic domain, aa 1 .. 91; amino acid feature: extracellular domain, aa 115 .. 257; amino acid feature: lectin-like domain, aa 128 .. 243; amino acid feature: transmembrane domain, aa 92 .. 114 [Gallus gallus]
MPLFLSFSPRSLREVLAKKSAPPAPLCPQPDPSLLLSLHAAGAVPHLYDATEEKERLSPSPPREATTREGDEERQSQRGSGCSELRQNRRRVLCVALSAVPCMLVLALVAVIVLQRPSCSPRPPFSHVCPNAWVGFQGKCYYFSDTESDWNSSREHCHRLGASLATLDTKEEMEFMLQYQRPADRWIGLHRAEGDEHWTWADGSAFTNRPVFELRGGGRCAYLNGDGISSALCHSEKFWVCSRADSYVRWRKGTNPQ